MGKHERRMSIPAVIPVLAGAILLAATALITGCDDEEEQSTSSNRITASSMGVTVEVEPADDGTVSGTVDVSVTEAPEGTNLAFFTIKGPGITDDSGPNLGIDDDGSDGWGIEFDSSTYGNGSYEIGGLAMVSSDSNPLGVATAQVTIEN